MLKYILITTIILLIDTNVYSADYHLLSLEELSMVGERASVANRDPLAAEYTGYWQYNAALNMRFNVLGPIYWDNQMHMETALGQPRTVGWHWIIGIRVVPELDVIYEHHSRHIVDEYSTSAELYDSNKTFPVQDAFGIKLNIYTNTRGEVYMGLILRTLIVVLAVVACMKGIAHWLVW